VVGCQHSTCRLTFHVPCARDSCISPHTFTPSASKRATTLSRPASTPSVRSPAQFVVDSNGRFRLHCPSHCDAEYPAPHTAPPVVPVTDSPSAAALEVLEQAVAAIAATDIVAAQNVEIELSDDVVSPQKPSRKRARTPSSSSSSASSTSNAAAASPSAAGSKQTTPTKRKKLKKTQFSPPS
jgi:hypothetical protein